MARASVWDWQDTDALCGGGGGGGEGSTNGNAVINTDPFN